MDGDSHSSIPRNVLPHRRAVHVPGVVPIHWRNRTAEDLPLGSLAWVSFDGEWALSAEVIAKYDRDYDVAFLCSRTRNWIYHGAVHYFRCDEVRSTPTLACSTPLCEEKARRDRDPTRLRSTSYDQ